MELISIEFKRVDRGTERKKNIYLWGDKMLSIYVYNGYVQACKITIALTRLL